MLRRDGADRAWVAEALAWLRRDAAETPPTPLRRLDPAGRPDLSFVFKDESAQPTGSLKHRLARSLLISGLCSGQIGPGTVLVEASSGSTAVSEAWFAHRLGLRFVAVMPRTTSAAKVAAIEASGGECHFVADAALVYSEAARIAAEHGGVNLDQFSNAAQVVDWRRDNIAEELVEQAEAAVGRAPDWVVMGAGTGGTATTIGRYIRYRGLPTRLCVADVEFSAFFDGVARGDAAAVCDRPSRIEGVGRPRMEPSFYPGVVDVMLKVPDAASIAAMHALSRRLGQRVGASTGAAFYAACAMAAEAPGTAARPLVIASVICDSGERYLDRYFDAGWLAANGFEIAPIEARLARFLDGEAA
ncbi:MAG: cysteine synthase [Rhodovulum sulfidophilum]|uniref:Cysteine synthase n=1 Tax=Rhodovulum sulfidophilum TaxID=35806 RepID=A0A2W5PUI9_RHOSU|nr:MAG: cysteine synthase [Rhodovulum sulfidophilum]